MSPITAVMETLENLGYDTDFRVLNALDFGLPQKREQIFIVGFREPRPFSWNVGKVPMKTLSEVLEQEVPEAVD